MLVTAVLVTAACRGSDQVASPGENPRIEITSDPDGAAVFLDNQPTNRLTPALLRASIGQHDILARLVRDNVTYGFRSQVDVKADSLHHVSGPLTMRCSSAECGIANHRYNTISNMRVASNPNGALFYYDQTEKGLYWPANTNNGYASVGMPLIAGIAATRDTLSVGIYDLQYLAGRPSPQFTSTGDRSSLKQTTWIIPPTETIVMLAPTMRGIEVEEELIDISAINDVAFIKLTFRNITNRASYQAADPIVPLAGITYTWTYLGFGLDADIGTADDDAVSYDPQSNLVFTYDMNFSDGLLTSAFATRPSFVGLKLIEAPAGVTVKAMNVWPKENDWIAGQSSERSGWSTLAATRAPTLSSTTQRIGAAPQVANDYRMAVAAGPLTLAPGAAASITVAVIVAPPVTGTYTSGQNVTPGNPAVAGRAIERVAAALLEKARAIVAP